MDMRRAGIWTAALALIVCGILILLQIFGVHTAGVWNDLWPFFLIVLGLEILFRWRWNRGSRMRLSPWGIVAVAAFMVIAASIDTVNHATKFVHRVAAQQGFTFKSIAGNGFGPTVSTSISGTDAVPTKVTTVRVEMPYANVKLIGHSTNQLAYHGTLIALKRQVATPATLHSEWSVKASGATLILKWNAPSNIQSPNHNNTSLTVDLPSRLLADVQVDDSEVNAQNLRSIHIQTSNATVNAKAIKGDAWISSSNGVITLTNVGGSATVRTSNGLITLDHVGHSISATTTNGAIRIHSKVGGNWTCDSTNGGVLAQLLGTPNAAVSATTTNGLITGNATWSHHTATSGSATYGAGKYQLNLRTTNGGVAVNE